MMKTNEPNKIRYLFSFARYQDAFRAMMGDTFKQLSGSLRQRFVGVMMARENDE